MWKSDTLTKIYLSSTESENIEPIQAILKTITIVNILKETKVMEYNIGTH